MSGARPPGGGASVRSSSPSAIDLPTTGGLTTGSHALLQDPFGFEEIKRKSRELIRLSRNSQKCIEKMKKVFFSRLALDFHADVRECENLGSKTADSTKHREDSAFQSHETGTCMPEGKTEEYPVDRPPLISEPCVIGLAGEALNHPALPMVHRISLMEKEFDSGGEQGVEYFCEAFTTRGRHHRRPRHHNHRHFHRRIHRHPGPHRYPRCHHCHHVLALEEVTLRLQRPSQIKDIEE